MTTDQDLACMVFGTDNVEVVVNSVLDNLTNLKVDYLQSLYLLV